MTRVGARMSRVLCYVAEHPGCTKGAAAAAAANQDLRAGYRAVDRCIRVGLVAARPIGATGAYRLHLTAQGRDRGDRERR